MITACRRAAVLAMLLLASSAQAVTRHVPSEYATINRALDASSPGDSVLVAPGTYGEYETRLLGDGYWYSSVAFLKTGVVLVSEGGPSMTTLRLDSTPELPILCRAFGVPGVVEVSGFTMTGSASGLSGVQFGEGGTLRLRDCVFRDLGASDGHGLAVATVTSNLEVRQCRFENLTNAIVPSAISQTSSTLLVEDSEFVNCRSGAMRLEFDDAFPHATGLTMRRCQFLNNVKTTGGGGAVYVIDYSTVLIEDCWFEGNQSITNSPSGGAVMMGGFGSNQIIRRSTFVRNLVDGGGLGGAIYAHGHLVTIEGNTFFGNSQELNWSNGGSAVAMEGATNVFRNNVVASSTGDQAVSRVTGTMQTGCNVYWANPLGNTSGFQPDPTDLQADPLFCGVLAKDFHVNAASPCIPGYGHSSCTELIGAWGAGCGVVSVDPTTWGHIKAAYRGQERSTP